MDALQLRDNAREQLAQIKSIETGTDYLNKVKAIEVWAKAERKDAELQNAIAEQKIRTQRILGNLLKESEVSKSGGDGSNQYIKSIGQPTQPKLNDYGITKNDSSNFQRIASLPEDIFEQEIAVAKEESEKRVELTTGRVLMAAKEYAKKAKKDEKESKRKIDEEVDEEEYTARKKVKRGDVIRLGDHLLICGDAYGYKPEIKINAIISDPPYGIDYNPNWKKWDGSASDYNKIHGDNKPFDPRPFMNYDTMLFFGANYFSDKLPLGGWVVWDKRTDEKKDEMVGNPFELAWFISEKTTKKSIIKRVLHGGVINADSENGNNEKRHVPTQKPVALIRPLIEELTDDDDIIYDPFLGSGTTLLACELSGRRCVGVEIEEDLCDVIIARWEKLTGGQAQWQE